MNGLELKWVGEGDALRLNLSVPGVSALYPVADIIAALKANPEACAEVRTALDPYAYAVRDDAIARAESAERERDALKAKLAEAERVSEARRDDLTLLRMLIKGGAGRLTTDEGVSVWTEVRKLEARLTACEKVVEAARFSDTHGSGLWREHEDRRDLDAALRAYDAAQAKDSGGSGAAPAGTQADADLRQQAVGRAVEPEPAGGCRCGAGCKPAPRYDGDEDSPVGVAATAMGGHVEHHKPAESPSNPEKQGAPSITRADLSALEERIVERVARAVDKAVERHTLSNGTRLAETRPLASLADELRRKP